MHKIIITTVFAICSLSMHAQFHGGSGTESDPYLISDGYDLADIANYRTSHFKQISDIDLSEWIVDNAPQLGWMPIGTKDLPFQGGFDGGNYTIKGLIINRPTTNYVGLFGYVSGKEPIKNVLVEGPTIVGDSCTGVIAGYSEADIDNCKITAATVTVKGISGGGVCGQSKSSITNCNAEINALSGVSQVGGIVGASSLINSNARGNISKCIAIVKTINGTTCVGGIAGLTETNITQCYAYANISAEGYAGGICGKGLRTAKRTSYYTPDKSDYPASVIINIDNCSYDGTISSIKSGGILGYNFGMCYNLLAGKTTAWIAYTYDGAAIRTCLVRNATIIAEENAAGIDAYQSGNDASYNVENCVSLASLVSSKTTDNAFRIVSNTYSKNNKAYNQTELIQNNKKLTNIEDNAQNGVAYGEKTLMRSSAYTGLGWDFNTIWTIQEGESYPYFQTQTDYPVITEVTSTNKASIKGTCKSNGWVTIIKNNEFIKAQILDNTWEASLGAVNQGDTLLIYSQTEGKMPSIVVRYIFDGGSVNPDPQGISCDANGDGVVDSADVTAIINYILGKPSASFNKANADVNSDGEILIDDAVQTVQMIMDAQ